MNIKITLQLFLMMLACSNFSYGSSSVRQSLLNQNAPQTQQMERVEIMQDAKKSRKMVVADSFLEGIEILTAAINNTKELDEHELGATIDEKITMKIQQQRILLAALAAVESVSYKTNHKPDCCCYCCEEGGYPLSRYQARDYFCCCIPCPCTPSPIEQIGRLGADVLHLQRTVARDLTYLYDLERKSGENF